MALAYFDTAVRLGSPFEAYYYLGRIHSAQASTPGLPANVAAGSCAMAVQFHKQVSERGAWDEELPRDAELAWVAGTERSQELAMLKWWIAAERGSEVAQSNMAYLLDQGMILLVSKTTQIDFLLRNRQESLATDTILSVYAVERYCVCRTHSVDESRWSTQY